MNLVQNNFHGLYSCKQIMIPVIFSFGFVNVLFKHCFRRLHFGRDYCVHCWFILVTGKDSLVVILLIIKTVIILRILIFSTSTILQSEGLTIKYSKGLKYFIWCGTIIKHKTNFMSTRVKKIIYIFVFW